MGCYEDKLIEDEVTNKDILGQSLSMVNYNVFVYPSHIYHYNASIKGVTINMRVKHIKQVTGSFVNVTFTKETWLDDSTFQNVIFKNCHFDKIYVIRWATFDNCQFINCNGTIRYARCVTWKKNCSFTNSSIKIDQIDEYIYVNAKRYDVCSKYREVDQLFNNPERELKTQSNFLKLSDGIADLTDFCFENPYYNYKIEIHNKNDDYMVSIQKKKDNISFKFADKASFISGLGYVLYSDRKIINDAIKKQAFKPSLYFKK